MARSIDLVRFENAPAGKAQGVVDAFSDIWAGTIIDVGCRDRELEAALGGRSVRYVGVDIDPSAEVVADLGRQLPFDDDSADIVVALDVLEHTDDVHYAFSELCRVAKRYVLITLPNCYDVNARIAHLRGKPLSGKYGLPNQRPSDRHRWFFSLDDARAFVAAQSATQGWLVVSERGVVGPRRERIAGAVRRWPNLLSSTYLALLTPR